MLNSADQIEVPMRNMAPSPEPLVGDVIEVTFGQRTLKVRVSDVREHVAKNEAATMYEKVED